MPYARGITEDRHLFALFTQFRTFHWGLDHSGSQPFMYSCVIIIIMIVVITASHASSARNLPRAEEELGKCEARSTV